MVKVFGVYLDRSMSRIMLQHCNDRVLGEGLCGGGVAWLVRRREGGKN